MSEMQNTPQVSDDDEIDLLDLLQTVAENIRLLILGPLVVGLAALGISFLITPTFTATTKFLPPQQQQSAAAAMLQSLGALGGLAGAASGIKNPNDQFVAFLQSRTLEERLVERFKLMERYNVELRSAAVLLLEAHTRISSGKDGLITVDVDDHDPAFAAQLANAYVEELHALLGRLAVTEAQQRRQFFEKQLQSTKEQLTKAESALRATGVSLDAMKNNPEAAVGAVAQIQAQVAAQEVKVASMRGYLTESAPDFRQGLNELAALRAQLEKIERGQSSSRSGSKDSDSDYVGRYREFKYFETLFELFAKQFEIAKVDEAREGAVIQILDPAIAPDRKSKPKKAIIAVASTLIAGFILLVFVLIRKGLQNARRDPEMAGKLDGIRKHLRWRRA